MEIFNWIKRNLFLWKIFIFVMSVSIFCCAQDTPCNVNAEHSELHEFPSFEKIAPKNQLTSEKYAEYQMRWKEFLSKNPSEDEILTEYLSILSEINPDWKSLPPEVSNEEGEFHEIEMSTAIQMVKNGNFEGAGNILQRIQPEESVVPALVLFYRAIVQYHFLQKEECQDSLLKLEQIPSRFLPKRFQALALLMKRDMNSWTPESLEHISRQMRVVEQYLSTGNLGENTVAKEGEVIESLDKMIEKLEEMQKKQQAKSSSSPRPSGNPAKDAKILGGNGPGKIDKKTLKSGDTWGNLPEKQRENAIQRIENEFPAHYQNAIEQYFIQMSDGETLKNE